MDAAAGDELRSSGRQTEAEARRRAAARAFCLLRDRRRNMRRAMICAAPQTGSELRRVRLRCHVALREASAGAALYMRYETIFSSALQRALKPEGNENARAGAEGAAADAIEVRQAGERERQLLRRHALRVAPQRAPASGRYAAAARCCAMLLQSRWRDIAEAQAQRQQIALYGR